MQTSFPFRPFSSAYTDTATHSCPSHYGGYSYSYPNLCSRPTGGRQVRSNEPIASSHDSSPQSHIPSGPVLSDDTTRDTPSIPNMDGFSPSASTRYVSYEPHQRNRDCFLSDLAFLSGNFLWPTSTGSTPSQPYHARPRSARVERSRLTPGTRVPWLFHTAFSRDLPRRKRRGSGNTEHKEQFPDNYVHSTPTQSRTRKDKSVHWGQTPPLSGSDYHYDCENSKEPSYPAFHDHHDADGHYHMSGAIDPLDYDVFSILTPEHNLDLNHNLGVNTGRSSPEIMVNRPDFGIGDNYAHVDRVVDPFTSVDPFRRERATAGTSDFRDPIARANLHAEHGGPFRELRSDVRSRRRPTQRPEQLHNLFAGPTSQSFPHTDSYAHEKTQIRPDSPLYFSTLNSDSNSTADPPSLLPPNLYSHDPFHSSCYMQDYGDSLPIQNSDYQRREIRNLLAELRRLHASLSCKRFRFRHATACLDREIIKTRFERASLKFERKKYRRWHQQMKDACLEYERWQQGVREEAGGRRGYWESNETDSWGADHAETWVEEWGPGFDGVRRGNDTGSSQTSEPQATPLHAPPGTPQESSPRPVSRSASGREWFGPSSVNMKLVLDIYDKAWAAVNPTDPSWSLPWPSHDLSGLALDQPNSYLDPPAEIRADIPKLREWNVFSFFIQAYGFFPHSIDGELPFHGLVYCRGWDQRRGNGELLGLKKQLKIEATRWHPDKLGKRQMSFEAKERAKSVFHGIGRAKSLVEILEEHERKVEGSWSREEDI